MGKLCLSALLAACLLWACTEKVRGHSDSDLDPPMDCPSSPNCRSTLALDPDRRIEPMQLKPDWQKNWERIPSYLTSIPGNRVVENNETLIQVECKSRIFGFVDDLTLKVNLQTGRIDIRSASRAGYYDFGVNKRRIQRLRQALIDRGIIAASRNKS
jgi:uncharacterized protein (DUF1499 family)